MQNKTNLTTHNEIISSEPWHRGSGFTWMLLVLAGAVFFFSGAVVKAQQNIYSRDNAGTGDWWNDANNPWWYSTWGSAERRPDIWPVDTRNNLFIGHNNNTTMSVNGWFFAVNSLTIQSGASSNRTFNSASGGGIGFAGGFSNDSAANQIFNTAIGIDAATVNFNSSSSGSTEFTSNFYLNNNTAAFGGTGNFTLSGVVSGTGGISKTGSGSLYLSGGNTFTGTVAVSGGTLQTTADSVLANNASLSITGGNLIIGGNDTVGAVTATAGRLSVASGKSAYLSANSSIGAGAEIVGGTLEVNSGTTLTMNSDAAANTSAITIASGGTLKGSGTTTGALCVDGVLAPGNSTGILDVGSTTFLGGGRYQWEIDNFTGTAGASWDFLNIAGNLSISATSVDQFIIDVVSLLASNDTAGLASNFNDATNYSFAIATASGTISGYASDAFSINTTGFQNSFTGTWGTSLSNDGKSLNITYTATAIPEPSSAALTLIGLGVLALRRRCG